MRFRRWVAGLLLALYVASVGACPGWAEPVWPAGGSGPQGTTFSPTTFTLDNYKLPGNTVMRAGASIQRTALANGLVVITQESTYDNIVAIEVLVRCGLSEEGSNLSGYTNLVLELISSRISRDSEGVDDLEITGSVLSTTAMQDYGRISMVTTSDHAEQMLRRIDDALNQPVFTEAEVDKVKNRLASMIDGTGGAFSQLYEIFLANFYRYHPYKRTSRGSSVVLRRATAQEVNDYVGRNFSANRLIYSVSGNITNEKVVGIVSSDLSGLVPIRENKVEIQWEPKGDEREVYLSADASLAWVMIGYPAPPMLSPDYAAARVLHCALGDGLSSRLWMELREVHGLAYELGADYPDLLGPSHLLCYVVTRPTSVGESRRRLLSEIKRIRKEGISAKELEETKNKLKGKYLLAHETNTGRALAVAVSELSGAGYLADSQYLNAVRQVSVDDVNRVARQYLDTFTLIVARPGGRMFF